MNFARPSSTDHESILHLESLEDRQMLSSVTIFAAGEVGQETFDLKVNNQVVASYVAGGDFESRQFESFTYTSEEDFDVTDLRIEFTNDQVTDEGDYNLYVDKIVVDGVTYETEHQCTYTTRFLVDGEVQSGFFSDEALNINGAFRYSEFGAVQETPVTRVRIDASGSTGEEIMQLLVDGQVVSEFNVTQDSAAYFYSSTEALTPDRIQVAFVNDFYDDANGIDRNLQVNAVQLINVADGARTFLSTNDSSVFSTGTWTAADGVVDGFGRGNVLHANGYFEFAKTGTGNVATPASALADFSNRIGTSASFGDYITDSEGRNYKVATGDRTGNRLNTVGEVMIIRLADNGELDPTFGDNGVVILDGGEDTGFYLRRDLAFDSNGNIGYVFNDTRLIEITSGNSAGAVYNFQFNGSKFVLLNSDGSMNQSFDEDGMLFVPRVDGVSVISGDVSFDSNDNFLVNGIVQGERIIALRGSINGLESTVRLDSDKGTLVEA